MEYWFPIIIIYLIVITILRVIANGYFAMRLKRDNPEEFGKLNIKHYPLVGAMTITDYVSLGHHLKSKDNVVIKLGSFLNSYYEKAWVFSAVYPLLLSLLVVFVLYIAKT